MEFYIAIREKTSVTDNNSSIFIQTALIKFQQKRHIEIQGKTGTYTNRVVKGAISERIQIVVSSRK